MARSQPPIPKEQEPLKSVGYAFSGPLA